MKLGFVSLPFAGHHHPMTALARKMQARGHQVVFIGVPDAKPFALAGGLPFLSFCDEEFPAGSIAKLFEPAAKLHGLETPRWSVCAAAGGLFMAASLRMRKVVARLLLRRLFERSLARARRESRLRSNSRIVERRSHEIEKVPSRCGPLNGLTICE
jgi:hypothetical protein